MQICAHVDERYNLREDGNIPLSEHNVRWIEEFAAYASLKNHAEIVTICEEKPIH